MEAMGWMTMKLVLPSWLLLSVSSCGRYDDSYCQELMLLSDTWVQLKCTHLSLNSALCIPVDQQMLGLSMDLSAWDGVVYSSHSCAAILQSDYRAHTSTCCHFRKWIWKWLWELHWLLWKWYQCWIVCECRLSETYPCIHMGTFECSSWNPNNVQV